MAQHACQVVNESGKTVYVKIVGHLPNVEWFPDLQGTNNTGLLFTTAPKNQSDALLNEGVRYLLAWDSSGGFMVAAGQVDVFAPRTITIDAAGNVTAAAPGP